MITAKSQRVHKVLDADYVPTMANEELFHLHCDFMLSVFTMVFKTDKSKSILKEHVTLNKPTAAQDIWRDLQEYFKGSTTSRDQIEQYRNYCSTTWINDGKWKGNTHSYILHFQQQVRNYDKLAPKVFTPEEKMQYLQQAVQPLPDLQAIKGTTKTLYKALKKDLSYEDYFDLLSSAAQTYNLQHSKQDPCNLRWSTRHVYAHDVDTFDTNTYDSFFDANEDLNDNENLFDFSDDYELNFHNIDTPIYELNATRRIDPSTQLPKHIYQHLDVTGKRAWIALPDALKHHLVKNLTVASPSTSLSAIPGTPSHSLGTQQHPSQHPPLIIWYPQH